MLGLWRKQRWRWGVPWDFVWEKHQLPLRYSEAQQKRVLLESLYFVTDRLNAPGVLFFCKKLLSNFLKIFMFLDYVYIFLLKPKILFQRIFLRFLLWLGGLCKVEWPPVWTSRCYKHRLGLSESCRDVIAVCRLPSALSSSAAHKVDPLPETAW